MIYFIVKTLISALIIATVSELSRRFSWLASVLVSLPLVSILAFIWIYVDTRDKQKIITMSYDVFWLVLPSLAFFLVLPLLLKQGIAFGWALLLSCICMVILYGITILLVKMAN